MAKNYEYYVSIPLAGHISLIVEAKNAQEAKDKAWDLLNNEGEKAGDVSWGFMDVITQGNVLYAPLNEVEVERGCCLDDDDDDDDESDESCED